MSNREQSFIPRWASPPGDTIRDALAARRMTLDSFADALGATLDAVKALIEGAEPISIDSARRLSKALGGTAEFWIARDGQYRQDASRLQAYEWAKRVPLSEMASFGWVDKPNDWVEHIDRAFGFFGVSDVEAWHRTLGAAVEAAHFRSTDAFATDPIAVAAWLREAELEAEQISCAQWDPKSFRQRLADVLKLTRQRDPAKFVPQLTAICEGAGVAVTIVRAPRHCPASGAARFLGPEKAQIVLSARYRSDDHLWFTFFHESAHLLLHDPEAVYVDELEERRAESELKIEREADNFAADCLVPGPIRKRLSRGRPSRREVVRLAKELGIAPGIIVGHLQHEEIVGYASNLNRLKRRYRWNGSTLEKA